MTNTSKQEFTARIRFGLTNEFNGGLVVQSLSPLRGLNKLHLKKLVVKQKLFCIDQSPDQILISFLIGFFRIY